MPALRKRIIRTQDLPAGFVYRENFLSVSEEEQLLAQIHQLPLEHTQYLGYIAKRRSIAFGWDYDFESRKTSPGPPLPDFLLSLRTKIKNILPRVDPHEFVQAIVIEYAPGAAMGWHRDVPQFGIVFGISLASSCRLRLRLIAPAESRIASIDLAPRSAYVFQGESRWQWQHSVPSVCELRYSITFRTLRGGS